MHADPTIEPLLITIEEAGRLLGVKRSTVYVLVGSGELPRVRIGRCARVPRVAVDAYIEQLLESGRPVKLRLQSALEDDARSG